MSEKSENMLRQWMDLWNKTDEVYVRFLKQWGLSLNAYLVVEYLHRRAQNHAAEPAELADAVNVMRQLITIILNDLEKRGYILRQESPYDHRRRQIMLSPEGEIFAETVCHAMDEIDLRSLSTFSEAEQNTILAHSRRFYDALVNAINNATKSRQE